MIVAIDGPAGSGKSTVAKALARRLGVHYLDTGAMYRCVALAAVRSGVALDDEDAIAAIAHVAPIQFVHEDGSPVPTRVLLDEEDVTLAIRTPEIDEAVSAIARLRHVREAMVAQQRIIGERGDLVVEGRDIGTVVFPHAEIKIYLTASAEERSRRRHTELVDRGEEAHETDVHRRMVARDAADTTRAASPLRPADDAVELDTTGLSIDEVVERIASLVEARR